jgi:hypothetical protein
MSAVIRARLRKLEQGTGGNILQFVEYDLHPTVDDIAQIDRAEKLGKSLFVHEGADRLDGWLTCSGLPRPWAAGMTA